MNDHDPAKMRGIPVAGISNGEETELAGLMADGSLDFAEADGFYVGPGSMNPQDTHRLQQELAPVLSISYGNVHDNEFDPNLEGREGLNVYHEMLTDGTVENALNYLAGSMQSVDWKIRSASDDEEDIQIAAWIADQLGLHDTGVGKYPFGKLLTTYLHAIVYGRSHGEIVLAQGANDRVILDKIVPIHPLTVAEVEYDEKGGPKNLKLDGHIRGGNKAVYDKKVPVWKTVSFLHKDDGTWNGRSFLRAAVAHWRVKRSLIVMINQSVERFLIGVPQIKVPRTVKVGSVGWQQARKLINDFVQRPRTGLVLPPDWEFEVVKLQTQMPDAKPYLEYHDAAMARAMGMDWNTISSGEGMKYTAMGALEGITKNTVRRLLNEFVTTINLYLIPKLVMVNWPRVKRYPRIGYDMESREDFSASANLMGMLINASQSILAAAATASAPAPRPSADGEPATQPPPSEPSFRPEQLTETLVALMKAMPPRFKRALGYDEVEMVERMEPYRQSAHRLYPIDNRKLPSDAPKVRGPA